MSELNSVISTNSVNVIKLLSFCPLSVYLIALSGGSSSEGSGSGEPLVIQNHLHMNGREIASIVSETTAKVGSRRQRHFR
jgi:hypothetical protein